MTENYRLPENAEASIVGCILLCPDTKPAVGKLVSERDFSSPAYGAMFSAAMELDEPDSVAFRDAVKQRGITLPDGFFSALGDVAVSRHNVELYARLLREDSQKRQLKELGQQLQESTEDAAEIITSAASRLQEIERGSITADVASPVDSFRAFWDHRKRVESGSGAVPTGFAPLDAILGGGMLHSGLYILAARPGMGKTTAALQFADSIAANVGPVLFVSLEMSLEQIEGKRIARVSGIPSDEILLGNGKNLDYRKIRSAAEELKNLPLHISRRPAATVAQIRRMAKQIEGLQCVVVDYLGKITPSNPRASRYEATTATSGDLKTLAVELGIPVLCLAQLNRENTGRTDKRPQLSDLRDSGAIEQDADGVIMLHRADYYEADETPLKPWESVELQLFAKGISATKGLAVNAARDMANAVSSALAVPSMQLEAPRATIPSISAYSIPALAQGSVIPANPQFTASINRAESGGNIGEQLSAIMQALQNSVGNQQINITVESVLDGKVVARNTVHHINDMTRQAGKPVLLI